MTIYWVMFCLPILFLFSSIKVDKNSSELLFFIVSLFLIIIIGLRHEVGGDWFGYIKNYSILLDSESVTDLISVRGDIFYESIYFMSIKFFDGIYTTNLISSIPFVIGLIRLIRISPYYCLALSVSVPYIIIIVSMGYTRQAAALGFLMIGLVHLLRGDSLKFYILVLFGALFHKTVIIMLALGYMYNNAINLKNVIIILVTIFLFVYVFMLGDAESMIFHYITDVKMHSSGALIRSAMMFFSAIAILAYKKKLEYMYGDMRMWKLMSYITVFLFPFSFYLSTFIDRLFIYFLPLQIVAFSRVASAINSELYRVSFVIFVLFLYAMALFVWINFGVHTQNWIPYDNRLFQ